MLKIKNAKRNLEPDTFSKHTKFMWRKMKHEARKVNKKETWKWKGDKTLNMKDDKLEIQNNKNV